MACNSYSLSGISLGCSDNIGGIKFVDIAQVTGSTITATTNTSNQITGLTGVGEFKRFDFRKQSGNLESTTAISDAEGTVLVTSNLNLKFAKMETAKRTEIVALTFSNVVVKVTDQNGKVWFLGLDNPVTATAAGGATGTNFTDGNSYTITLTDLSKELPKEILI